LIEMSVAQQQTVALSSGEAEFVGITRGAAQGKLVQAILEEFKLKVDLAVLSDSSAARAMCRRVGVGRVKHLDLKQLWIQEAVAKGELTIECVDTDMNWADLGTKAHDPSKLQAIVKQIPLRRRGLEDIRKGLMMLMVATGSVTGETVISVKLEDRQTTDETIGKLLLHVLAGVGLLVLTLYFFLGWGNAAGHTALSAGSTAPSEAAGSTAPAEPEGEAAGQAAGDTAPGAAVRAAGSTAPDRQAAGAAEDEAAANAAPTRGGHAVVGSRRRILRADSEDSEGWEAIPTEDEGEASQLMNRFKVDELKAALRERRLPVSGLKRDLIARLRDEEAFATVGQLARMNRVLKRQPSRVIRTRDVMSVVSARRWLVQAEAA